MTLLPKLEINRNGRYAKLFLDGIAVPGAITSYQIAEEAGTKHCTLTVTMDIQKKFTCTCDTGEDKGENMNFPKPTAPQIVIFLIALTAFVKAFFF